MTTDLVSDAVAAALKEASAYGRGFPMAAGGHFSSQAKFDDSSRLMNVLLLSENPKSADMSKTVACNGKVKFQSHMIASKVLKRMEKSHGSALNAYKCQYCGFIHIGGRKNRIR